MPLADVDFVIPALVRWFEDEWAPWYGPNGNGDAMADLLESCDLHSLPIVVVALGHDRRVLGTAALKPESLGGELGLSPWLAAMLVGTDFRNRGIGNELVRWIEEFSKASGYEKIYATTDSARSMLLRRGWMSTGRTLDSMRGPAEMFERKLA